MVLITGVAFWADELLYDPSSEERSRGGSTRSLLVSGDGAGSEFAMPWKEKLLDSVLKLERIP
jgi:hypothetical protein